MEQKNISWGMAAILLVVAFVLGRCTAPSATAEPSQAAPDLAQPVEAVHVGLDGQPNVADARKVTIAELISAYARNEMAAQTEYGNQPLLVTGKVESIDLDISDEPVVRFVGDTMPSPSLRFLKGYGQQAATLQKGRPATFLCTKLSETMGAPSLSECTLAP